MFPNALELRILNIYGTPMHASCSPGDLRRRGAKNEVAPFLLLGYRTFWAKILLLFPVFGLLSFYFVYPFTCVLSLVILSFFLSLWGDYYEKEPLLK